MGAFHHRTRRMNSRPVPPPNTRWLERIDPDEPGRHAELARRFASMQAAQNARHGAGRSLHRRSLLALRARLEVLPGLPAHAAHGLFARPGSFEAWVRLSNGSATPGPDPRPDVRGYAIKVLGVEGPGALGAGPTQAQDFLLIQNPSVGFASSEEFAAVALASVRGPLAVAAAVIKGRGWLRGLRQLRTLAAGIGAPFSGFATQPFHSALPFCCGPYAARARLLPAVGEAPAAGASADWALDLLGRLAQRELRQAFQLQFFVDEAVTPIEDPATDWPERVAPYLTVAHLVLPVQSRDEALQRQVEAAAFDPWCALQAHRPLGELMRARRAVYYASQQGRRGAA
jgi:hypothetical protein